MGHKTSKTALLFKQLKEKSERPISKIVCVTAYDYTFAKLVDDEADIVLVGDSLGMVIQGEPHTLKVTLEEMIYHTRCVSKGISSAHLCVDMPFLTYQVSPEKALENAGRLVQEGGAHSVKLEGGLPILKTVEKMVTAGIPVLGHIGLTPQRIHEMGGYRVQGKTSSQRDALRQDALALQDAGAYALVLEGIPSELAQSITESLKIPTIGIGAGPHCDGQVLVLQDLLGLNLDFQPKFVKQFAQLGKITREAIKKYADEVRSSQFPNQEHSYYAGS